MDPLQHWQDTKTLLAAGGPSCGDPAANPQRLHGGVPGKIGKRVMASVQDMYVCMVRILHMYTQAEGLLGGPVLQPCHPQRVPETPGPSWGQVLIP